mgnify:CR=1 FL=1
MGKAKPIKPAAGKTIKAKLGKPVAEAEVKTVAKATPAAIRTSNLMCEIQTGREGTPKATPKAPAPPCRDPTSAIFTDPERAPGPAHTDTTRPGPPPTGGSEIEKGIEAWRRRIRPIAANIGGMFGFQSRTSNADDPDVPGATRELVVVTDAGLAAVRQITPAHRVAAERLVEQLGAVRAREVVDAMVELADVMDRLS